MADRPHLLSVSEHHLGDVRLNDPRDGQGVAGRLKDDAVVRREARDEESEILRRGCRTSGRTRPSAVGDRNLAEVPVYVHSNRPGHQLPPLLR